MQTKQAGRSPALPAPPVLGRDELNLAEFPIAILQRQQPTDREGNRRETVVFESSRYDPVTKRRVPQKVTVTAPSKYGLPTPADEQVVVALLYVSKHTSDFAEPSVQFVPHQLIRIMGWSVNTQSYRRLEQILDRLQSVTIKYENAYWDTAGRNYRRKLATGIIADYELIMRGKASQQSAPASTVIWRPTFYNALRRGSLKMLDIRQLFALKLPISQRMYRFLDKRFHTSSTLEMDLRDFACGHIGLTDTQNIAHLKQRLAPAIDELESIRFVERAESSERYCKVRPGVWRIRFERNVSSDGEQAGPVETANPIQRRLVTEFYRRWQGKEHHRPTRLELVHSNDYVTTYGPEKAESLIPLLVEQLKRHWPKAKTFGATARYVDEASREYDRRLRQIKNRKRAEKREQQQQKLAREQYQKRAEFEARWKPVWRTLSEQQRREITSAVVGENRLLSRAPGIEEWLCLKELARRRGQLSP